MSFNFSVCSSVRNKINCLNLNIAQKAIVARCVGGYSSPIYLLNRLEKIHYRWIENINDYPDWKQSAEFLEDRQIKWLLCDSDNPSVNIVANMAFLPWIFLELFFQESGEEKLKKFIQENNHQLRYHQ
jgi:hypothetical protein